LNKALQW